MKLRNFVKKFPKPSWTFLLYWVLLLGASYIFIALAEDIREQDKIDFDQTILIWLDAHSSALLTRLAHFLNVVGSIYILGPLSLFLAIWLWAVRRRAAVFLALAMLGVVGLNQAAKLFFARLRPDLFDQLSAASNFAFPSGHTMGSTAFALALYFIAAKEFPRYRLAVAVLGFLFAFAVGLSRAYLQVHYPSDVVGGWALAFAWVLGLYSWFRHGYLNRRNHS